MQNQVFRYDWKVEEINALLTGPLDELLARANRVHQEFADKDVQQCALLSVKTGSCQEDRNLWRLGADVA